MRTYLVVVDESPEAETALRFAARRAAKTAGAIRILALIPPAEFVQWGGVQARSEEHTSELQSLMRISYAVFCLKKKTNHTGGEPTLPTCGSVRISWTTHPQTSHTDSQ